MKKYQVSIRFFMDDWFMDLIPKHRELIDQWIKEGIIDHYVVTMESLQSWMTFTSTSKKRVEALLRESPLHRYWTYEIAEIFVFDGPLYRMPTIQWN